MRSASLPVCDTELLSVIHSLLSTDSITDRIMGIRALSILARFSTTVCSLLSSPDRHSSDWLLVDISQPTRAATQLLDAVVDSEGLQGESLANEELVTERQKCVRRLLQNGLRARSFRYVIT